MEDSETHESADIDAEGGSCKKCKMRWFMNLKACVKHEKICEAMPATESALDADFSTITQPAEERERERERERAREREQRAPNRNGASCFNKTNPYQSGCGKYFIDASTGPYKSLSDDIPDHVNPETGCYKYGVLNCSTCNVFKQKHDFSSNEVDKRADRRVCNYFLDKDLYDNMFAGDSQENW